MIIKAGILSEKQKKEIWQILVDADKEFIPPLSSRNDTTQKKLIPQENSSTVPESYFHEMLNQSFILCIEEGEENIADEASETGRVTGFLSYRRDHKLVIDGKEYISDYVSTIIVAPEVRNMGYTQKMYEALFEAEPGKSYSTRTWSTNHAHIHILEKLGFELKLSIKDDRGEGIDTVYYVKV